MICFWIFFTTFLSALVLSKPTKEKISVCQSMLPKTKSNAGPQTSNVPFQVLLDKETVYPGDIVTLLLLPIGYTTFVVDTCI